MSTPPTTADDPAVPIRAGRLFEAHLAVRDLARSVRFYRDALGLPVACTVSEPLGETR